jgi:hypothetical protein
MIMHHEYVKVTSKGKVSVSMPGHLKYEFQQLLELFMNDHERGKIDMVTVDGHIHVALMSEIYSKYHTQLCFVHGDVKIMMTLAQAYALWAMCQKYSKNAYGDATMGGILFQLHQRLS